MKVAFIADARNVHTQRWASSLAKFIDELFVISVAPGEIEGCKVYDLGVLKNKSNKFMSLLRKIRYILCSLKILFSNKPDIIHVHYLFSDITVLSYAFFSNVIISVWGNDIIDDTEKPNSRVLFFRKLALKNATMVTATTHYLAKQTQKYCSDKNIMVIPFGVDLNRFRRKKLCTIKPAIYNIGFVKHLLPKYGPHVLIKAVRYIKNPVKIFIVGKGAMESELKKMVNAYKLKNVFFKGFIPNEKLPNFLENIDIFVMPSIYDSETFGVSAIEAQAMEIPVIASLVGGVPEAVKNGVTGLLIPPNQPKELAITIDKLIEDHELYEKLKYNCRKFVEDRYDWNKNILSVVNLYKKLL